MKKTFSFILGSLIASLLIAGCSSSSDGVGTTYLRVYSCEDYIYLNDPDEGYDKEDMTIQFEKWVNTPEIKSKYGIKNNVEVIYDTFDTLETMYNQLKLAKTQYDVVCPSDYMIQRLALNKDGLESTNIQKIDYSKLEYYSQYVSPFLRDTLQGVAIDDNDLSKGTLYDYGVGYMWGTLGLVYNPSFASFSDLYTEEEVIAAFSEDTAWSLLWENDNFAAAAQIKDSIRDTYSMGIMHVYEDEFILLKSQYEEGLISTEDYKKQASSIFNRHDEETIKKVEAALIELKTRIYGFEVDTGKADLVTGKVGVGLQWSGDAVYSLDTAENDDISLCYALPSLGANIWFDGWAIMEQSRGDNLNAAYAWLDFLSIPEHAADNMDYIGYTSFVAGDEVLELIHDWYDAENEEDAIEYDLSYFFDGTLNEYTLEDAIIFTDREQSYRQLHAQYPQIDEIDHLYIMRDFGSDNDTIVTMWENVKVNPLPVWVQIFVICSIVLFIAYLGSYPIIRKATLNHREKLRKKNNLK